MSELKRWPSKGDWMTFLGRNGYEFELTEALDIFKVGEKYQVQDCDVQNWSHSIKFAGVPGRFNGVMFAAVSPCPQETIHE
jgi:hypothetical protein